MDTQQIQIRNYPEPNPKVKGSSTRFAVKVTWDDDKLGTQPKEELAVAEPECPVCDFKYDPDSLTGKFFPKTKSCTVKPRQINSNTMARGSLLKKRFSKLPAWDSLRDLTCTTLKFFTRIPGNPRSIFLARFRKCREAITG